VSFLNAKPLAQPLEARQDVAVHCDVPSRLLGRLTDGEADAALLPVVDLLGREDLKVVSDACIACDGPTLTVRVFCNRPPQEIRTLMADTDSRTSVALARLIWKNLFGKDLEVLPLHDWQKQARLAEAMLLIGDKVIQAAKDNWPYQVDLGQAWKRLTGLPFVFAVWATRSCDLDGQLARILSEARDAGCARAEQLAERYGPPLGWPVPLARKYLTHYMRYHLDGKALRSIETFRQMLHEASLLRPEES